MVLCWQVDPDHASSELMDFMALWRRIFADAWTAASAAAEAAEKRVRFTGKVARAHVELFEAATQVSTADEDALGLVLSLLAFRVRDVYAELNSPPTPAAAPEEAPPLTPDERGVVMYVSGWGLRCGLAWAYRHAKDLVPHLQQLVRVTPSDDDASDEALIYIESRELHGGLIRLTPAAVACFEQVPTLLHRSP